MELARQAAAQAARNALAAVVGAAGGLDNVEQCLRMSVFVACVDGFTDLSALADAASDELESHLGPGRRPARSAIGVRSLPGGAPIEIELTAVVRGAGGAGGTDRRRRPDATSARPTRRRGDSRSRRCRR